MADEKEHVKEFAGHTSHKDGCIVKCTPDYQKTKDFGGDKLKHSYRYNGHHYIMGESCPCDCGEKDGADKKEIYNVDFTQSPAKERVEEVFPARKGEQVHGMAAGELNFPKNPSTDRNKSSWKLDYQSNFQFAYLPYAHESHHMVPWDALNKVFADRQLKTIQAAKYNLNSGENIIILPQNEPYALIMKLPTHTDNHPAYTNKVINKLSAIKRDVEDQSDTHRLNEKNIKDVKTDIVGLEKDLWGDIVDYGSGQRTVARAVNDTRIR